MKKKVLLVKLSKNQAISAKAANGERKKITHAVVCEPYGAIFGTEKQCRRYYNVWATIYPELYSGGEECNDYSFTSYETTFNLVLKLINASEDYLSAQSLTS